VTLAPNAAMVPFAILGAALLALKLGLVPAAVAEDCLSSPEKVEVAGLAGPATVLLEDGRRVRLADIRTVDRGAEALAPRGSAELRRAGELGEDRHGRIPGDVVLDATAESLSIALLRRGLAFVDPAGMQEGCHRALFAAEAAAEEAGAGVWARGGPILSADAADLEAHEGRYALVEGTVVSAEATRRTVYLNFGVDYRTDFTALARRRDVRRWEDRLLRLEGERVRVRGVLEAWHGGLIRIEHPAQVERLEASASP